MPLLQFHVFEGRSDQELAALLDAAHRAVLDAFHVPERDRYQIVHEHKPSRVRFEDTGLGIKRSEKFVLVHISTQRHPVEEKTAFYDKLCAELERHQVHRRDGEHRREHRGRLVIWPWQSPVPHWGAAWRPWRRCVRAAGIEVSSWPCWRLAGLFDLSALSSDGGILNRGPKAGFFDRLWPFPSCRGDA
jgi:hypothetical protein